ncbi:MAG: hypothetical protein L0Y56_17210 [Nitrospira sp.]|nr:hypothetical protein [Nitrospira sp.]
MPEQSGSDLYGKSQLDMHGTLATPFGYPCDPASGSDSVARQGSDTSPFDKPESGNTLIGVTRDSIGGQGPGPGILPGDNGALATPMYGEAVIKGVTSGGDGFGQKGSGNIATPFDPAFGG